VSTEPAVGAVEDVEVHPLVELVEEEVRVVDHDAFELAVELFGVDAMRAVDFAVEPRCRRLDVGVADAAVQDVPVEDTLELGAVVGLNGLDPEGELLNYVVEGWRQCLAVGARTA
jgi:hypothetical protein